MHQRSSWFYQIFKLQGKNYSRQRFSLIRWGGVEINFKYLAEWRRRLTTINPYRIGILYNFSLNIIDCGQIVEQYTFFYKSCILRHNTHDITVDFSIKDLVLAYRLSRLRWDSHDVVIKNFELICKNHTLDVINFNEFDIYAYILNANSEWWSFRTVLDGVNHREVNGIFMVYEDPYITKEDSFTTLLREAI